MCAMLYHAQGITVLGWVVLGWAVPSGLQWGNVQIKAGGQAREEENPKA